MVFTLRSKLIVLYLMTVTAPLVIIIFILPYYYENLFTNQTKMLSEGTISSLTTNVELYLDDLERMTITPYLDDDVMTALKLKASNGYAYASEYSRYTAERAIGSQLPLQLRNLRRDMLGTLILPMDGTAYFINSVDGSSPVHDYPYSATDWYRAALAKNGDVAFIGRHSQDYLESGAAIQVFSVARLLKDPDSGAALGVILTNAASSVLENIMEDVKVNPSTLVAILDGYKRPLYSNQPISDSLLSKLHTRVTQVSDDSETYNVVMKGMPKSGWSIVVLFSDKEFQSQLQWIYRVGMIYAVGSIALTFLLHASLTHWIVNPFREMVQLMKKVQRGQLNYRLPIRGKDEIAQLGATLNTMIAQLQELIDREYRAVLGQRDAEYRALQSQIQPHFLYNTLAGLIGLNRNGQQRLLEKSILSLSNMLRYTTEHEADTTLGEEVLFLERYCELQKLRFDHRFSFRIQVNGGLAEATLPKLLLQPLVENAIIHGIEPLSRAGTLQVAAEITEQQWLLIRIEDNGVGFDPALAASGIGLQNVRSRLQLFDQRARMDIRSALGQGSCITLYIPLQSVGLA